MQAPSHIVVAVFLEQVVRVDHPGEVGAMQWEEVFAAGMVRSLVGTRSV